ncbi:transporter substrate-binding domain-containing protein [Vibrio makurazakiensis]|uniref:substrate-binding periplasmic protein n=1 Tax=Vibrio makurazakiensis TaxID=2910250 RepID=UPI003D0F83B3
MRRFLLIWILGAIHSHASERIPVVVYADDAYPPYSYEVNGVAKGIYADILRIAFSRMPNYTVSIIPVPFKRGLKMLETGKGFALYPPYFYANKRSYISPYSTAILDEEVVVYCNQHKIKSIRNQPIWPDDFFGMTIGINESFSIGGDEFWQAEKDKNINVEPGRDNRENVLKLRAGRIDCYINDKLSIQWEVKQLKESGDLDEDTAFHLSVNVSSEHGYLAYSGINENHFPYKADFVEKFDTVILDMINNGEIQFLLRNYAN